MKKAERHIRRAIELMNSVSLTDERNFSFGDGKEDEELKDKLYEIIDHGINNEGIAKYNVKYEDEDIPVWLKRDKLMPKGGRNDTLALYEVVNDIKYHKDYIIDEIEKETCEVPTVEQGKTNEKKKCYRVRFLSSGKINWPVEVWWARKLYPKHLRDAFLQVERQQNTRSTLVYKSLQTHIEKIKNSVKPNKKRSRNDPQDAKKPDTKKLKHAKVPSISDDEMKQEDTIMSEQTDQTIHVFYDDATKEHEWTFPNDPERDHQESPSRIKWALDGVHASGVNPIIHELKYDKMKHEQRAKDWIRDFQLTYELITESEEELRQEKEIRRDASQQKYEDGFSKNVEKSMKSVYASTCVLKEARDKWLDARKHSKEYNAICLIRPPGHHGQSREKPTGNYTEGFCILNNVVILTHHLLKTQGTKVVQIDLDYHRGDGNHNHLEYVRELKPDDAMNTKVFHIDVFSAKDYPQKPEDRREMHCQCIKGRNTRICSGTNSHFHAINPENFGPKRHQSLIRLTEICMQNFVDENTVVIVQLGVDAHLHDAGEFVMRASPKYTPAITRHYYEFAKKLREFQKTRRFSIFVVLEGGYHQLSLKCSISAFLQGLNGMEMINNREECGPEDESHAAIRSYKALREKTNLRFGTG